jgi:hypothetical protein
VCSVSRLNLLLIPQQQIRSQCVVLLLQLFHPILQLADIECDGAEFALVVPPNLNWFFYDIENSLFYISQLGLLNFEPVLGCATASPTRPTASTPTSQSFFDCITALLQPLDAVLKPQVCFIQQLLLPDD